MTVKRRGCGVGLRQVNKELGHSLASGMGKLRQMAEHVAMIINHKMLSSLRTLRSKWLTSHLPIWRVSSLNPPSQGEREQRPRWHH